MNGKRQAGEDEVQWKLEGGSGNLKVVAPICLLLQWVFSPIDGTDRDQWSFGQRQVGYRGGQPGGAGRSQHLS